MLPSFELSSGCGNRWQRFVAVDQAKLPAKCRAAGSLQRSSLLRAPGEFCNWGASA
jgi:hypothetical protein